jgi:hypothetical protein
VAAELLREDRLDAGVLGLEADAAIEVMEPDRPIGAMRGYTAMVAGPPS